MSTSKSITNVCRTLAKPLLLNFRFFTMMYALGIVVAYSVVPNRPNAHVYDNLWLELFADVYVVCALLVLLPAKVRRWVRRLFAAAAYMAALADVFCFVRFQSTLNPTMLLLAFETDKREAGEFFSGYVGADLLQTAVGWVVLLMAIHAVWWIAAKLAKRLPALRQGMPVLRSSIVGYLEAATGLAAAGMMVWAGIVSAGNKAEMWQMFSCRNIGEVEHELTTPDCANFYQPLYRLAFSLFSNHLAAQQVSTLIEAKDNIRVDSCSFRSPEIVLIIGESYNKYHSALYGYDKPTTPRQIRRRDKEHMAVFTDVVAPWNLTSFVFKNMFSLNIIGQKGEWCDYPLFPEVFRKAGYHTRFITNQFLPKAREAVYDFSGGFFLNNPELSRAMFDERNSSLHTYDEGLLADYDRLAKEQKVTSHQSPATNPNSPIPQLTIFHLMGQHVNYHSRYPRKQRHFYPDDYDRPDLSQRQRDILSHYDNAVLYNDSVVDAIVSRFEQREAVVIYIPDHGEECFNDGFKHFGRNHNAEITPRLAHQEFDVPMWIWCSDSYVARHADVWQLIVDACRRPMMTDTLPQMLLYLAGISTKDYQERYNILSPNYDIHRPRVIKATVDYNRLVVKEKKKQ